MLLNISDKISKELVVVLTTVKTVADELDMDFFVVGAAARDIIMEYCYGIKTQRATLDVDLGIRVEDWSGYERLVNALAAKGFQEVNKTHRYRFNDTLVDILPFGPIADNSQQIIWPPENAVGMSILGFKEAYQDALLVRICQEPCIEVKISSVVGMVIMKMIAWDEKKDVRRDDARDLLFLIKNYEHTGAIDRLYDFYPKLLELEQFNVDTACVRLLGREIIKIADKDTTDKIKEIIKRETELDLSQRLLSAMHGSDDDFEQNHSILEKLKQGIFDVVEEKYG